MLELTENTKIKYTLENEHNEQMEVLFTLEQIEGAKDGFYKQLKSNFDDEDWKIIKREIEEV